ncbi:hypothetical protein NPIL_652651 [Nephila pilipes]|uniref:Uncharacterized protein n=1 Tax=Nephila pilipes TaxID=299642 RepID=A0A8X6T822_NEPPI|nr:hypothetical protein NPIL_652651 [Nephila pilipes]
MVSEATDPTVSVLEQTQQAPSSSIGPKEVLTAGHRWYFSLAKVMCAFSLLFSLIPGEFDSERDFLQFPMELYEVEQSRDSVGRAQK